MSIIVWDGINLAVSRDDDDLNKIHIDIDNSFRGEKIIAIASIIIKQRRHTAARLIKALKTEKDFDEVLRCSKLINGDNYNLDDFKIIVLTSAGVYLIHNPNEGYPGACTIKVIEIDNDIGVVIGTDSGSVAYFAMKTFNVNAMMAIHAASTVGSDVTKNILYLNTNDNTQVVKSMEITSPLTVNVLTKHVINTDKILL